MCRLAQLSHFLSLYAVNISVISGTASKLISNYWVMKSLIALQWLQCTRRRTFVVQKCSCSINSSNLPDSMRQRLFGAPRSTNATRLLRNARRSTYTWALSAELAPCTQMAGLTRQPNDVDTQRVFKPNAWNSLQNCCVNWTRGRSSATTTQVRTHAKLTLFFFINCMELLSAFVHSSMTPYEQNVSRTRYCDNVLSHRLGFASTSYGAINIEWWPL